MAISDSALKKMFDDVAKNWETFKAANDDRIQKIEDDKGVADLDEKLVKLNVAMDDVIEERETEQREAKVVSDRLEVVEAQIDGLGVRAGNNDEREDLKAYAKKFEEWMRSAARYGGQQADAQLSGDLIRMCKDIPEYKDISTTAGATGGFAVPEVILTQIEDQVRVLSPVRGLVRVVVVGTSDYKELLNIHGENSGWVGEGGARAQGTTPTFRERKPTAGTLFAYPRATEESMDDVFFNVGQLLIDVSSEEFAIQEGTAVFLGNGTNRPTGMLNTAPVTTDDDASPPRSAEVLEYVPIAAASPPVLIDPDELFTLVYTLRERYTPNARWVFNRLTAAAIRKLKDTQGQYLWAPGLVPGEPTLLLGFPTVIIGALANLAADSLSVLFGDFNRGYLMTDRVGLRITVDANITVPGFINWYIRKRVGGIIKDNNAIKVGKFSIS